MKKNEGQAIFEFILFVPFIILMYAVSINIFGAINGSINQQKVVRGYFYGLLKGNSTAPGQGDLNDFQQNQVNKAGMLAFGWKKNPFSSGSDTPVSPCYKFTTLTNASNLDECGDETAMLEPTSYIRVKTVYGICGKTYRFISDRGAFEFDTNSALNSSCLLTQ
jgi:hypothetical protein